MLKIVSCDDSLGKMLMEPDRYQQNHKHYIVGLICLVISLGLFAFSAYVLPFLFLSWHYIMPDFILNELTFIKTNYQLSAGSASWLVFLGFFMPAILFAVIADILSNRIDNQIYGIEVRKKESSEGVKEVNEESRGLVLKIILIVVLVFILARLFQWTIATTVS